MVAARKGVAKLLESTNTVDGFKTIGKGLGAANPKTLQDKIRNLGGNLTLTAATEIFYDSIVTREVVSKIKQIFIKIIYSITYYIQFINHLKINNHSVKMY